MTRVSAEGGHSYLDVELSTEDARAIEERLNLLKQMFDHNVKPQYKLELLLCGRRPTRVSAHIPVTGILSFWENGMKTHGGGDSKVYLCPGHRVKGNGCYAVIPSEMNQDGFQVCSSCKSVWKPGDVVGEVMGNHTLQQWSTLLHRYFMRIGSSADIYLKLAKGDLFAVTEKEQERRRGGELLDKVRSGRQRDKAVYPFRNILKDAQLGKDLSQQFLNFLYA